jgi:hypothetical protein
MDLVQTWFSLLELRHGNDSAKKWEFPWVFVALLVLVLAEYIGGNVGSKIESRLFNNFATTCGERRFCGGNFAGFLTI